MTLDLIECRIYNPAVSKSTKTKAKSITKLHFVNKTRDMIKIRRKRYLNNSTKQSKCQHYIH